MEIYLKREMIRKVLRLTPKLLSCLLSYSLGQEGYTIMSYGNMSDYPEAIKAYIRQPAIVLLDTFQNELLRSAYNKRHRSLSGCGMRSFML